MKGKSPAEIMLNSLVPAQRLIKRLQGVLKDTEPPKGISISNSTKATIAAFRDDIQSRIDELTAQREKAEALIKRIDNPDAQWVILLRYGFVGLSCEKMPYPKICENMNYENETIFRYRKKGIEQLNQMLENGD